MTDVPNPADDLPDLPPQSRLQRFGMAPVGFAAFCLTGLLAVAVAIGATAYVESRAKAAAEAALSAEGMDWAEVNVDGLRVVLRGTAPDEAARFRAVNVLGGVVDSGRVRDKMDVAAAKPVKAPRFSVEMLRNDDGIQLIGLLPEGSNPKVLTDTAQALLPDGTATNMLETAAYPAPEGWGDALRFGLTALQMLPRSKISVSADGVEITAIAASVKDKQSFDNQLAAAAPKGLPLKLAISAPRPVLTPFTLRFVMDGTAARFDACSADTEAAQAQLIRAGVAAGAAPGSPCVLGMGSPSPRWGEAGVVAIAALAKLGQGTVTFSDTDVTLLAGTSVKQADFDLVVGDLRNALPDVFSLDAQLQKAADAAPVGPAEFTADLAADTGRITLRGRLTNELTQSAVDSYAKARFGLDKVYLATRLDDGLPDGWPKRVLAGLQALGELHDGKLVVRADRVSVSGTTGSKAASARISQILSDKLGQGQTFEVDVKYDEALDPLAALPTPEECLTKVDLLVSRQKITFAPGSTEIDSASGPVLDAIAAALAQCSGLRMEIGGHTDAQGSEGGNPSLSQARAEAVMVALQGRQVDVSAMRAVGYGESRPIGDNGTDAGREINRRIEFTLIGGVPAAQRAEAVAAAAAVAPADAAVATDDGPSLAPQKKTVTPKSRPKQ